MSKTTEKVISIKIADDATSPIRNLVRVMRSLASAMRQIAAIQKVIEALQKAEFLNTLALASAYRYLALMKAAASMIGIGAALLAVAASIGMMAVGTNAMPVSLQTSPGQSKTVTRTGLAFVHEGETYSRGGGGHGGGNINIVIHSADMSYRAGIEETARDLGTLIFQAYRRIRH